MIQQHKQLQQGFSMLECLITLAVMTLMMIVLNNIMLHINVQEVNDWQKEQHVEQVTL